MATATTSAHGHAAGGHGHNTVAMNRLGLWLFFASEAFLFALIGTGRYFMEGFEAEHLNQQLGLAITVVLVTSSVTAYIAETAMEHDRRRLFFLAISITMLLGVVFGGGVAYEWSIAGEHFGREGIFGSVFFTMTGLHASHVMTGLVLIALVVIQAARGKFNGKSHWPVSAVIMYWHFVDVVWVFYYPTLYLVQGVE